MKARQKAGEGFKPVEAGVHAGVITGLVDLGKQPGTGQIKDAYKIATIITFPGQLNDKGEPMTVTKLHTSSMFKLSNLRKDIESLFGKVFPSQEAADDFEFKNLLGRAGFFNIQHKQSGDKVFANVVSMMPLPQGMEKPVVDPSTYILYDSTAPDAIQQYQRVPAWLQKKIDNQIFDHADEGGANDGFGDAVDDDVPF